MPRRTTTLAGAAHRAADSAHDSRRRRWRRPRRLPRHRVHGSLRQDHFPRPGVVYPEPFDMDAVRAARPREEWPALRTYTVRAFDPVAGELTIDFVHHGDAGLAGPWAAAARPGDPLLLLGPGGAYAPDPTADWHLLVGDESALPAIGAALERVPAGAPVHALVEVDGPADEQNLTTPGRLDLRWSHRDPATRPEQLVEALAALPFPAGRVHASCTARPGSSARCAGTCSTSAGCRATTCRCRATGAAATTRRGTASSSRPSGRPRAEPTRIPGNRRLPTPVGREQWGTRCALHADCRPGPIPWSHRASTAQCRKASVGRPSVGKAGAS